MSQSILRVCLFRLGQEVFAIEGSAVRQVLPEIVSAPLPDTSNTLRGLFAYQGRIIPLVNIHALLGHELPTGNATILLEQAGEAFAIGADRILDFSNVVLGATSQKPYLKNELEYAGGKAYLLDLRALITALNRDLAV